ncbi:hypothetical protein KKA14_08500 [bacterium]|nr:hypothetical protein [bacterium]
MEISKIHNDIVPDLSLSENEEQLTEEAKIVYLATKSFLKSYFRDEDFGELLKCLQEELLKTQI